MSSGIQAVWPPRVAVLYFSLAVWGGTVQISGARFCARYISIIFSHGSLASPLSILYLCTHTYSFSSLLKVKKLHSALPHLP